MSSENKLPLVSVIIPCFNQEQYIKDSILSVINQTYKNIEIICIDDCSKDNSYETIKKLADSYPNLIILKNISNIGVGSTRNIGIEKANGKYILPLDGDDYIESTYVEEAVNVIENSDNNCFVYCKARLVHDSIYEEWELPEFNINNILFNNCIFCTALFKKSDFLKAGGYQKYMNEGWEDYDLWLTFLEMGLIPYRINKILFNYRIKQGNSKSDHINKSKNVLRHIRKQLIINHLNLYTNNDYFLDSINSHTSFLKKFDNLITEKNNIITEKNNLITELNN